MNEEQTISELKRGSEKAIGVIMKEYGSLVKYIVIRILGRENQQDIEECMADIFYEIWTKIDGYDPSKGTLKGYVIGIARHKALNRYRILAKEKERHMPLDEEIVMTKSETEETVLVKMENHIINEVIDQMPEPERSIFIKRYFWCEKIKDIASALKLDTKFVENKLYREKVKLKQKLIERGIHS